MRTIKDHLVTIAQTQSKTWVTKIGEVQLAINCTKSKATGHAPLELLIGKKCAPPQIEKMSIIQNTTDRNELRHEAGVRIAKQATACKKRFDSKCAPIAPFKLHDFVLCKDTQWPSNKLGPKFLGPYQITKILNNDRYEVKSLKTLRNKTIVVAHEHVRPIPSPNLENDMCDNNRDSEHD